MQPHAPNLSDVTLQTLFHMTASIMEEHAGNLVGVDLLVDSQGSSCSDELLVQMKEWYSQNLHFNATLSVVHDFCFSCYGSES